MIYLLLHPGSEISFTLLTLCVTHPASLDVGSSYVFGGWDIKPMRVETFSSYNKRIYLPVAVCSLSIDICYQGPALTQIWFNINSP